MNPSIEYQSEVASSPSASPLKSPNKSFNKSPGKSPVKSPNGPLKKSLSNYEEDLKAIKLFFSKKPTFQKPLMLKLPLSNQPIMGAIKKIRLEHSDDINQWCQICHKCNHTSKECYLRCKNNTCRDRVPHHKKNCVK